MKSKPIVTNNIKSKLSNKSSLKLNNKSNLPKTNAKNANLSSSTYNSPTVK